MGALNSRPGGLIDESFVQLPGLPGFDEDTIFVVLFFAFFLARISKVNVILRASKFTDDLCFRKCRDYSFAMAPNDPSYLCRALYKIMGT